MKEFTLIKSRVNLITSPDLIYPHLLSLALALISDIIQTNLSSFKTSCIRIFVIDQQVVYP